MIEVAQGNTSSGWILIFAEDMNAVVSMLAGPIAIGCCLLMTGCATPSARQMATLNEFSTRHVDPTVLVKVEKRQALTVSEIAHAVSKRVPESAITDHIDDTRAVYQLQAADVDTLRAAGASDELINQLLATPARNIRRYEYGYPHYPFYYHRPYYHGGIHFGHRHIHRHHGLPHGHHRFHHPRGRHRW